MNEEELEGMELEITEDERDEDVSEDWSEDDSSEFNPNKKYTKKELELMADALLREDANRELCRKCRDELGIETPYGRETGEVEWIIQKGDDDLPLIDDDGNTLYVGFPELQCANGHRWYKGEGPRRDIRGPNPILFETHLYNRKRREIHVKDGIPDPAFTMDRWGKRPTTGIYNRSHPQGRKVNSPEARAKHGASYYR